MDFDEAYDDTKTSVDQAARLGNVVLLKELLQQGYPTNGQDSRGWRPLHEAAAGGHVECVRLLLLADDAEVDALTHNGLTALHLACDPGECHTQVVKLLLRAGADPNMKCGNGFDLPLPKAVLNNQYDIVKLLLDAGANPNRTDIKIGAPLMASAEKGHLKIARLLVERGAKVDFQDDEGCTAIHFLLRPKRYLMEDSTLIPFIDLLVNGGLDVNARMNYGITPLMMAVRRNKVGLVMRLLELGADPNIEDNFGVQALHNAIMFWPDSSTEGHDGSNSEGETTDHIFRRILDPTTSRVRVIPAKLQKIRDSIFHLAVEWDKFNTLKLMVNGGLLPDAFLQDKEEDKWLDEADIGQYSQVPTFSDPSKPLNEKCDEMAKFTVDKGSNINGCPGLDILEHLLNNGADVMHKISATVILPAALHLSSLFNVQAFFALLVRCVPVHEIYTPRTLESLSQLYATSKYYKSSPLLPWRVISWLNVVNAFVPQLPLDTKNMFDIQRMVEDDHLSRAWDDLDAQIGSPKKLEQLCILTVRRVVGERRGWNQLMRFLRKLTLMNEPLPDLIVDLLTFKQMESSRLSKWPPRKVLSLYVLSAANSWNDISNDEDDPSDDDDDDDDTIIMTFNMATNKFEYDQYYNDDDGGGCNCDKEDDARKGGEEQNDDSVEEEEEEEEEENKRKKMKIENE